MKPFWTITDIGTVHTNSRSSRFENEDAAITAATNRLERRECVAVVVLKSVKLVKLSSPPVEVEDITD